MKGYKCIWVMSVSLIMVVSTTKTFAVFQVVDANYTAQVYATYSDPGIGKSMGMTFDNTGNLYVTQLGDDAQNRANGAIYKITPDGSASRLVENIGGPRRIVWAGGSSYGETLYVAEINENRDILKIALDGTETVFTNVATAPHALALDRFGNYGGHLYTATRGTQNIYSISTTGNVSVFSSFPPDDPSGSSMDLVFDPGTAFGGSLYLATSSGIINGIHSIDTNGNATNFASDFDRATDLEIDRPNGIFGGNMLATARKTGSGWAVWNIDPLGNSTQLIDTGGDWFSITLGPDGFLYLAEHIAENDLVNIYQVTPEPLSLSLLGLGGLWVMGRKRRGR